MATRSAGAITVSFEALTGGLNKGVDEAKKKIEGFGGKLNGFADGAKKIGGEMVAIGGIATVMGAGIVGAGGMAVKTFASFDDQMRTTNAIMGGTSSELEAMTNQAKEFGRTTPHSATAVASGFQFMALAGWDAQQSMDAMPGLLALSSASGLDLAQTSDILTDTMSMFSMEASRAGEASDIFALAQARTNTSVYQLGEAMKYAGPQANALGMDLAETSAVLGLFGDNGIKGSMAGTTFTAMMDDMSKTNKDGANIMEKQLGVAMFDTSGKMRSMSDIVEDLKVATADMTAEQRNQALGAIFGAQSIKGLNALLGDNEGKLGTLTDELRNATGTAEKMAEEMEGGVGGGIRGMQSAIEGATLEIGEALAPVVIAVIPHIVAFAQGFANFVKENPGFVQAIGVAGAVLLGVGSVITTVGGFLVGLGTIIQSASVIFGFLKVAGTATAFVIGGLTVPVWAVVGAVAGLIAIGVALWANWDWISQKAGEVWNWVTQKTGEAWNGIKTFVSNGWNWVSNKFIEGVNWVKTTASNGWNAITGFFRNGINTAKSSVDSGIRAIRNTFKSGMDFITNLVSPVINQVKKLGDMAGGIKDKIGGGISAVRGMIPGFAQGGFVGSAGVKISRNNGDNRLITARDDEFIANRQQRDNIFEAIASGGLKGKGGSGGDTYNINAVDSKSFLDLIKRDGSLIKRTLKTV